MLFIIQAEKKIEKNLELINQIDGIEVINPTLSMNYT